VNPLVAVNLSDLDTSETYMVVEEGTAEVVNCQESIEP